MSTKITSPVKGYSERTVFGPTALQFNDGVAETDEPLSEGLKGYLEQRGYEVETEEDGPFDPSKYSVADVTAYLDGLDATDKEAHDAEVARVLEAERKGKNRSTLVGSTPVTPSSTTTPPADPQKPAGDQGDAGQQSGGDDQ
jgi:hypothetical protein